MVELKGRELEHGICIDVELVYRGRSLNTGVCALLDTGASRTVLLETEAKKYGIQKEPGVEAEGEYTTEFYANVVLLHGKLGEFNVRALIRPPQSATQPTLLLGRPEMKLLTMNWNGPEETVVLERVS